MRDTRCGGAEIIALDVSISNAGLVDARDTIEDFDDGIGDRDVAVNLTGTINVTRAVYSGMKEREWGRIVTMSSVTG
ncbi:SDR family NAD(P)-dependent oxidoreductase [Natrinema salsiterrestre]|uniref:SDR family oxidoreductase n=1 Tax=Natrinema salsiterrestre TaxID=2950540 RepID=A0A9Q4Q1K3_9EURY|nr:SDR family NAD(P)-dependent oxidoreductase [Natrinema salsiterrestre]MDF9744378.1 SDR family oxidoreductase [Natrinema salsiterrestre]